MFLLIHRGLVAANGVNDYGDHKFSGNAFAPVWCQAITWINQGFFFIEPSRPNIREILSKIQYCQTFIISHILVGNKIADHSDVAGASPVGAAPTTSSFST